MRTRNSENRDGPHFSPKETSAGRSSCDMRKMGSVPVFGSLRRGGALLAVLWLCAALSAITLAVASTVRGETERASTAVDGLRAYYLATGAIERAILWFQWGGGHRNPDGSPRFWEPGVSRLVMPFPTGEALVEVIPESSKLSINGARPEELLRLLLALGAPPDRAQETTAAIIDWRSAASPGAGGMFDSFYSSQKSSFRAPHTSFREIEELLFVRGMTPEIYHGSYARDPQGRLIPLGALKNCVSVYGSTGPFDINTVEAPVLAAIGFPPDMAAGLVQMVRQNPIRSDRQFNAVAQRGGPLLGRLTFGGGGRTYTLRATARIRLPNGQLSDLRRSVSALLRMNDPKEDITPYRVLRWYDNVWVDERGQW